MAKIIIKKFIPNGPNLMEEKMAKIDKTKENDAERRIAVSVHSSRLYLGEALGGRSLIQAIGYVSSHSINHVFVYAEEAQNLKDGKWYPYKVFFPTPFGWLKVDNNDLVFMEKVHYDLAPVETSIVVRAWEGKEQIINILGLNAPEYKGESK